MFHYACTRKQEYSSHLLGNIQETALVVYDVFLKEETPGSLARISLQTKLKKEFCHLELSLKIIRDHNTMIVPH